MPLIFSSPPVLSTCVFAESANIASRHRLSVDGAAVVQQSLPLTTGARLSSRNTRSSFSFSFAYTQLSPRRFFWLIFEENSPLLPRSPQKCPDATLLRFFDFNGSPPLLFQFSFRFLRLGPLFLGPIIRDPTTPLSPEISCVLSKGPLRPSPRPWFFHPPRTFFRFVY